MLFSDNVEVGLLRIPQGVERVGAAPNASMMRRALVARAQAMQMDVKAEDENKLSWNAKTTRELPCTLAVKPSNQWVSSCFALGCQILVYIGQPDCWWGSFTVQMGIHFA